MVSNKPAPHTIVSLGINRGCDSVQLLAWSLEEEEVTTREAILQALEAAN